MASSAFWIKKRINQYPKKMQMKSRYMKHLVFTVGLLIFSIANLIAQELGAAMQANDALRAYVQKLAAANQNAANRGEAAASFTLPIQQKLDSIQKRINAREAFFKKVQGVNSSFFPALFKRGLYMRYQLQVRNESLPLANDRAYCDILEHLITSSQYFSANKKAYYAKDNYQIPDEYVDKAKEVFEPMIDKLIEICNAHPDKAFLATIVTTGYADDEPIAPYSVIYYDLLDQLNETKASNVGLKYYLSHLRAKNLAAIIAELIKEKKNKLVQPSLLTTIIKSVGAGVLKEAASDNVTETNGKEKSRVVKVYWDILPNF